jgi:hypothetical protein
LAILAIPSPPLPVAHGLQFRAKFLKTSPPVSTDGIEEVFEITASRQPFASTNRRRVSDRGDEIAMAAGFHAQDADNPFDESR